MKRHIVCFGDSNTYGFRVDPADDPRCPRLRFHEGERWTCLLQRELGEDYLVLEEGLPGRTTVFDDPVEGSLAGLPYLSPCLRSHAPVSLLIVMLGTNDTKQRLGANAYAIGRGMERLVRAARAETCWEGDRPNILIVAPKAIGPGVLDSMMAQEMGPDCVEKSRQVPQYFQTVAQAQGCHFLDANELDLSYNTLDHMHLTLEAHGALARVLAGLVPTLVPPR